MSPTRRPIRLALLFAAAALPAAASAQTTILWSGAVTAGPHAWNTTTNWTGGNVANSNTEIANLSRDFSAAPTFNLGSATTINGLIYDDTGASGDVSGVIANGGTAGNIITFAGTTPTVTANSFLTISAAVAGTGFTKLGSSTLVLSASNTGLSGTLNINAGFIRFSNAGAIGTVGTLNLGGGNVDWYSAGTYGQAVNVTSSGQLGASNVALTLSGAVTLSQDVLLNYRGGGGGSNRFTVTSNVGLASGATAANVIFQVDSANTHTYSGTMNLGSGNLTKSSTARLDTSGTLRLGTITASNGGALNVNSAVIGQGGASGDSLTLAGDGFGAIAVAGSVTAATLTKTGSSVFNLTNASNSISSLVINAGAIGIGSATAISSATSITLAGGTITARGGLRVLSNAITAATDTTSGLANGPTGDLALTGVISGSGNLTYSTVSLQTLWLSGDLSGYTGTLTYNSSTEAAAVGSFVFGGVNGVSADGTGGSNLSAAKFVILGVNSQRTVTWEGTSGTTVRLGELSSAVGEGRIGIGTSGRYANWEVGALGTDSTFGGSFSGTETSLTKVGIGTLTLSGASTHGGGTTVSAGTLSLAPGASLTSAVNVASGAALSGRSTIAEVNLAAGAALEGGQLGVGALAVTTVNATGQALFRLRSAGIGAGLSAYATGTGVTAIGIGDLALAESATVKLQVVGEIGTVADGTYAFLTYGNLSQLDLATFIKPENSDAGSALGPRQNTSIAYASGSDNTLLLTILGINPTWVGDRVAGSWSGPDNWRLGPLAGDPRTSFLARDTVRFDDTGVGGVITLGENVAPGVISVVADTVAYTFAAGAGSFTSGTLNKSGAGALTLSGSHSLGAVNLSGGSLRVDSAASLGSATLTLAGGRLQSSGALTLSNVTRLASASTLGDATDNGALTFTSRLDLDGKSSDLTVASDVTLAGGLGNGGLRKLGAGTLTLGADATSISSSHLAAGRVRLGSANSLGSAAITLAGGVLSSDSATARTVAGAVTLAGDSTLGDATDNGALTFTGGLVVGDTDPRTLTVASDATFSTGVVSGAAAWTKAGAGQLTLSAANTFSGALAVSGGMLRLGNALALGANTAGTSVLAGGTVDLAGFRAVGEVYTIAGSGSSGQGAIINTGADLWNGGIDHLILSADAAVGGSGRFDIRQGAKILDLAGFKLTKLGSMYMAVVDATVTDGDIRIEAGTLAFSGTTLAQGTGTITVATGGTLDVGWGAQAANITRNIVLAGGSIYSGGTTGGANSAISLQAAGTLSVVSGTTQTLGGAISGGFGLTKIGAGATVLGGDNTYTGATTINAGVLTFQKRTSLYNADTASWTAANLLVSSGAVAAFAVGGAGEFTSADIDTLKGLGFAGGSQIGFNTANAVGAVEYSGAIANLGDNTLGVYKSGTGTLTLSGDNTYTGVTTVNAGVLAFEKPTSFYNADTASWTAANLVVSSGAVAAFAVGGADGFTSADIDTLKGLGFASGSQIGFDTTNAEGAFEYVGVIANVGANTLGVYKSGTGTLTLSGANTFTGTFRLAEGKVLFTNAASLGAAGARLSLGGGAVLANSSGGALTLAANGASAIDGNVTFGEAANASAMTLGGTFAVTNNPTLTFNAPVTFTNNLTGNFTVVGSDPANVIHFNKTNRVIVGAVTLSGANTVALWSQSNGLDVTAGSTAVTVVDGAVARITGVNNYRNVFRLGADGLGGGVLEAGSTFALRFQAGNSLIVSGTSKSYIKAITATTNGLDANGGNGNVIVNVTGDPSGIDLEYQAAWKNGTFTKTGLGTVRLGAGYIMNRADNLTGFATGNAIAVNEGTFINEGTIKSVTSVGGGTLKVGATTGTFDQINVNAGTFELSRVTDLLTPGLEASYAAGHKGLNLKGGTLRYQGISDDISGLLGELVGSSTIDTNGQNVTFATALTGTGGFAKSGDGTLTLSAANTFSGGATVSGGTLAITDIAALGTGNVTLSGGVLDLGNLNPGNTIVLDGGTLANDANWTGSVAVNGNLTAAQINALSRPTITITGGLIDFTGVTKNLIIEGGTHTGYGFGGNLTIKTSVTLDADPTGSITIQAGNLDFGGRASSKGITYSGGALLGAENYTGDVTLALAAPATLATGTFGGGRLVVGNGQSVTLGANYEGDVLVRGTGALLGASLIGYTGQVTLGNGASLSLTDAGQGGFLNNRAASFILQAGSVLRGQGRVGDVVVLAGGTLAPGNSPGLLELGNTVLNGGGRLEMEIWQASDPIDTAFPGVAGLDYDSVDVAGELDLSALSASSRYLIDLISLTGDGTVRGAAAIFDPEAEYSFTLITYDTLDLGANVALGTDLSSLFLIDTSAFLDAQGEAVAANLFRVMLDSPSNSIILTYSAIPEPSTYGLLLGGLALAAAAVRRRAQRRSGTAARN